MKELAQADFRCVSLFPDFGLTQAAAQPKGNQGRGDAGKEDRAPAKMRRDLSDKDRQMILEYAKNYLDYVDFYKNDPLTEL